MAEPKHVPRNAVVVERFQELNSFTQAFAAGHLRFLMLVGPAGTGKSRAMRSAVDDRWTSELIPILLSPAALLPALTLLAYLLWRLWR